jgi:hypothetical protein
MLCQRRILELGDGDELVSREGIAVDELVFEPGSGRGKVMVIGGTRRGESLGLKLVGMSRGGLGDGRS